MKVVWKVVKGCGPYAYLQKSERHGTDVTSKHVAYLGAYGARGLVPSDAYELPLDIQQKAGVQFVSIPRHQCQET